VYAPTDRGRFVIIIIRMNANTSYNDINVTFFLTKKIRSPCDDNRPRTFFTGTRESMRGPSSTYDNNNNNDNGIGYIFDVS